MDIKNYEKVARERIKPLLGTPEGEYGPTLFASHHLNELAPDYWLEVCGTTKPDAVKILDSLVLVAAWSSQDDDNIDVFDFSIPNAVSNYVLSARFEDGEVVEVSMES